MLKAQIGDKVRRRKPEEPVRGVIVRIDRKLLIVKFDGVDEPVSVSADELTNLSLAARRAWTSMPKRPVGRKLGVKIRDRVSVTLRIDRDLWEQFQELEQAGHVTNRTDLINAVLRNAIESISRSHNKSVRSSEPPRE